jgi:hypothetical protein
MKNMFIHYKRKGGCRGEGGSPILKKEREIKRKDNFFSLKKSCLPIPKEKMFGKERKFAKRKQSVCG